MKKVLSYLMLLTMVFMSVSCSKEEEVAEEVVVESESEIVIETENLIEKAVELVETIEDVEPVNNIKNILTDDEFNQIKGFLDSDVEGTSNNLESIYYTTYEYDEESDKIIVRLDEEIIKGMDLSEVLTFKNETEEYQEWELKDTDDMGSLAISLYDVYNSLAESVLIPNEEYHSILGLLDPERMFTIIRKEGKEIISSDSVVADVKIISKYASMCVIVDRAVGLVEEDESHAITAVIKDINENELYRVVVYDGESRFTFN